MSDAMMAISRYNKHVVNEDKKAGNTHDYSIEC